jgi:hypothetical protein
MREDRNLGWVATGLLMGHQVDMKKLEGVMASHARKNRSNAYFLELSEEEELALEAGDTEAAIKAFRELQPKFRVPWRRSFTSKRILPKMPHFM